MQRLFGALIVCVLSLGCQSEPLEVARVDLTRMQGKWFEIAKLPRATQTDCSGTTATYQLKSQTELLVVVRPVILDPSRPRAHDLLRMAPDTTLPAREVLEDALPPALPSPSTPRAP